MQQVTCGEALCPCSSTVELRGCFLECVQLGGCLLGSKGLILAHIRTADTLGPAPLHRRATHDLQHHVLQARAARSSYKASARPGPP